MGYNLLINGVYWRYNPLTNHLLTSWDIQVAGWNIPIFNRKYIFPHSGAPIFQPAVRLPECKTNLSPNHAHTDTFCDIPTKAVILICAFGTLKSRFVRRMDFLKNWNTGYLIYDIWYMIYIYIIYDIYIYKCYTQYSSFHHLVPSIFPVLGAVLLVLREFCRPKVSVGRPKQKWGKKIDWNSPNLVFRLSWMNFSQAIFENLFDHLSGQFIINP